MRLPIRVLALLPFAVLAAACGDGPLQAGVFELDGAWQGRAFPYELSLTFEHDDENQVTGSGELRGLAVRSTEETADTVVATRADVDVRGRWNYPEYTLTLQSADFHPVTMQSRQAKRDTIDATLRGSGFEGVQIKLVRQRTAGQQ